MTTNSGSDNFFGNLKIFKINKFITSQDKVKLLFLYNLIPIIGILFFGWNYKNLILLLLLPI